MRPSQDFQTQVFSGVKWTAFSRWATLLISWPATILLARLLTPADFGYLALVTVFTRFAALVAEGGLSSTIILGKELPEHQYRRLQGWSVTFFMTSVLLLLGAAIPIEFLYSEPGMRWIVLALASGLLLDGFKVVPTARMRRELRFREVALITSARVIGEAIITIAFAAAGYRYWALVIGHLSGKLIDTSLTLISFRMWPALPRVEGLEPVLRDASRLLVASMTTFVARSSDVWIGARVVGITSLGGYTFMKGLAEAPLEKVSGTMLYVTGSVFGNVRDDLERLRRVTIRMLRLTGLVMFPIFVGLALVAPDLVGALLGSQWLPFVPALQIYCIYAAILPLYQTLQQSAVASGASGDVARTGIMLLLIMPPAFFVLGGQFGATGLALAWLFPLPVILERLVFALAARLGLRRRDVALALGRPLIAVATMALVVAGISLLPFVGTIPPLGRLGLHVAAGLATYCLMVVAVLRDDFVWLAARLWPAIPRGTVKGK